MPYAMTTEVCNAVSRVIGQVRSFSSVQRATVYISPMLVVRATRRHKMLMNERSMEVVLTIGKPNYSEREFVKQAKKSGEKFPVKRIQLKHWKMA